MRRWSPVLLLLALTACKGGEIPVADPAADRSAGSDETDVVAKGDANAEIHRFLEVALSGQKVGGLELTVTPQADGTYKSHEIFEFALSRENMGVVDKFKVTSDTTGLYASDWRLVEETEVSTEAGVVTTTVITLDETKLVYNYDGPGKTFEKSYTLPKDYNSAHVVFLEAKAAYDKTGEPQTREFRSFSTDKEDFEGRTMTLHGKTDFAFDGKTVGAFEITEKNEDGEVIEAVVDENYVPYTIDMMGMMTAQIVKDSPFGSKNVATITSEIKVDGDAPKEWWQLASLELDIAIEGDKEDLPALWESSMYHDVKSPKTGQYILALKNTALPKDFKAPTLPMTSTDPEVSRFLDATTLSQSDDSEIVKQAKSIIGDETDAAEATRAIVKWVFRTLEKKSGARGSATATEVLAEGAGDCTEHASLTVALLRAAGIPARNASGIVFLTEMDGSSLAAYHAWTEVWLGQWVAVDATVGEVGTSARYLHFGYDEPGQPDTGARLARTLGRTSIKILSNTVYDPPTVPPFL